MNREDRIKLAIEKGYTCDPITGKVYGVGGKEITRKNNGYTTIKINIDKKQYTLCSHQFIYYIATGKIVEQIDHINGVRDDNRIENLRAVTHQQNQQNRTNAKGCYWNKQKGKWVSRIGLDSKKIYLGTFDTEQEAHQTYLDAKKIYHII